MTRLFDRPIDTVRGLVRFLAMAELDFWYKAAWDKQTLDMDRRAIQKRDMDRRAIGVSCILDAAFLYLPFFVTVLRYLLPPNIPLMQKVKLNCGRKWYKDVKSTRQDVIKSKTQTCPFSHCYLSGSPSFDRGVECLFFLCWLIYLFIYLFIFLCRFFKRTSSARHANVQCSLALTQSADRFIVIIVYF